jgi:hypothetical protein
MSEAEQALRRALDADSANAAAAYNLCVILSPSRLEEAIGFCSRAVASAPGDPKYSYTHIAIRLRREFLQICTLIKNRCG